jgi:hypothetical protein
MAAQGGASTPDSARLSSDGPRDSAGVGGVLPRSAATSEPTDVDLERGILEALARGLDGVARSLSERLVERRAAHAGNVVPIDAKRRRGPV